MKTLYNNNQQQNPYYQQYYQYPRYQVDPSLTMYNQPVQTSIKGRPVLSIEEARAAQIDLDGSLHIFTDIGNKKIYTKQMNNDGTASLRVYSLVETDQPNSFSPNNEYITREEFEKAMAEIRGNLAQRAEPVQSAPTPTPAASVKTNF